MTLSGSGVGTAPPGRGRFNPALNFPAYIPFDQTPGQANSAFPIDYTSTTGIKLFNSAILKLPEIFNRESKSINLFNYNLADRAKYLGQMETGANFIMISDSTGTPRKLKTEYGRLTVEDIETNIQHFIGKQTRQAQNSVQFFQCLTKSTTDSAHLKILVESDKYMDVEIPVGEILFKLMIQKAVIDTKATDTYLRENLTNLYTNISTVKLDI